MDFSNVSATNSSIIEHDKEVSASSNAILFLFVSFAVGALVRQLLKETHLHLPYTVVLFVLGILFGMISYSYLSVQPYTKLTKIDASVMMHVFLPVLIFESAYSMDAHLFMKSIGQCLILAVPGLIICDLLIAAYAKTVLSIYKWDWVTALLFGAVLSATDPVAVVALFKECGISPKLTTLIEGESLLNDGSAIVVFDVLLEIVVGRIKYTDTTEIFLVFLRISIAAPVFGYFMGKLATMWLVTIYKDEVLEFTITLCFAYLTYYLAETHMRISGVLSVVVLGVVISSEKSSFSPETEAAVHSFWEMMSYFANTLIFFIVGIIITERSGRHITIPDFGLAICTYVFITIFRLLMILILSPFLTRTGYGLTWKNAIALVWGGLRGAVGLALSMMLSENPAVDDRTIADKILLQLCVVILLTLIINGTTMKALLNILGLNKISHSRRIAMGHAISCLRNTTSKSMKVQKRDKFLSDANWLWVESHTHIRDPYHKDEEFDKSCAYVPYRVTHCDQCNQSQVVEPTEVEKQEMEEETRLRVLKSLKSLYWSYFEHSIISRRTVQVLLEAASDAIDKPGFFIDVKELKRKYMSVPHIIQKIRNTLARISDKLAPVEMSSLHEELAIQCQEATGFRLFCLRIYMKPYFHVTVLIVTLLNIVPIIIECSEIIRETTTNMILIHVVNALFLLVYVWEAMIKIVALGCRNYFKGHWNKYAFFIVVVGFVDLGFDLYSAFTNAMDAHFYVTLSRLIRLVRLFEMHKLTMKFVAKLVLFMKNVTSATLYLAYDLGNAYVAAQEEVLKKIDFLADYKPCGIKPLRESEKSILEMSQSLNKIQDDHPGVSLALKSHKAAMRILNDVLVTLKELHETGLVDEVEYELLLQEVNLLKRDILRSPKTLRSSRSIEEILGNVDWITDKKLLRIIQENYIVRDYHAHQDIHVIGDQPLGVSIITSGVVKVSGKIKEERENCLPNTDSISYFVSKGKFFDFLTPAQCLGILGYLVKDKFVTSARCETPVRIIHISYGTLKKAEQEMTSSPPLSYVLWRSISLKIAAPILLEQPRFQGINVDRMKIELEKAILPDLRQSASFDVDEQVRAVVVIQGRVRDAAAGVIYIGPQYVPSAVKCLHLDDDPDFRPRVVIVLLPEDNYVLPSHLDWSGYDSKHDGDNKCLYHTVQHRRSTMHSILPPEPHSKPKKSVKWGSKTSSTLPLNMSVEI